MPISDTGKAISKVSGLLKYWIAQRTGYHVEVGRAEPPTAAAVDGRLNLFLYQVHFDASMKNIPLREGGPEPLWLVLKYLMTAFDKDGNSESAHAHEYLGVGMRVLQELNYLSLTSDPDTVDALSNNPEPLKITFDDVNSDLISKLMQGSEEKYRFSVGFQVRPVMIAFPEPPDLSLPVGIDFTQSPPAVREEEEKGVHIDVVPHMRPQITRISPSTFEVEETVTVYGTHLDQAGLAVRLGPAELGASAQQPGKLQFKANGIFETGGVISAGSFSLKIVKYLTRGRTRSSNLLPANLLPRLDTAVVNPGTPSLADNPDEPGKKVVTGDITLTGVLLGTEKDDIVVSFYSDGKMVGYIEVDAVPPSDPLQAQLQFSITPAHKVPEGVYRLILTVNGQQARTAPTVELIVP